MNTLTVLLACLSVYLLAVNARHFPENNEETIDQDLEKTIEGLNRYREEQNGERRHRRRRWHSSYGYNYPAPSNPFYQEDYRRYDNQQDLYPRILRLLEEISEYVRRPPAPQPIYIPYPFPVPNLCSCPSTGSRPSVNVTDRFPDMIEDTNQNWGFANTDEQGNDDGYDGGRPISFEPIAPQKPLKRPSPGVNHGSTQAESKFTSSPKVSSFASPPRPTMRAPSTCDAAILSCCRPTDSQQNRRSCFANLGCDSGYTSESCSQDSIANVLDIFAGAYAARH